LVKNRDKERMLVREKAAHRGHFFCLTLLPRSVIARREATRQSHSIMPGELKADKVFSPWFLVFSKNKEKRMQETGYEIATTYFQHSCNDKRIETYFKLQKDKTNLVVIIFCSALFAAKTNEDTRLIVKSF